MACSSMSVAGLSREAEDGWSSPDDCYAPECVPEYVQYVPTEPRASLGDMTRAVFVD